jgi:IS30 family transposase
MLGRSKSTVQREARRFDNDDDYNPEEAQLQFEKMQAAKGPQISQSLFKFYETRRQKRNSPLPKSP